MSRRTLAPAIAIAVALVIAGCGGGDDDGDDDASASSSTTTTMVVTTTTVDPQAEPEVPFCVTWATFKEVVGELPQNTLPQVQARSVQITAAATSLASVAPDELQDEANLILVGAQDLEEAVAAADSVEAAKAAAAPLETDADYLAAVTQMETWVSDSCTSG